jgi:ABC-type glycerol-3-phosphate transport system permease component
MLKKNEILYVALVIAIVSGLFAIIVSSLAGYETKEFLSVWAIIFLIGCALMVWVIGE